MTVAKQTKKAVFDKKITKKAQEPLPLMDLSSLDALMEKIDALETEEQVAELFEEENLLKKSLQALLTLTTGSTEEDNEDADFEDIEDFDCEKVDENVMEIMSKFLDEGLVHEEEFEDFFTDELEGEDESEESETNESESENEELEEIEEKQMPKKKSESSSVKQEQKKKSKHIRELEMLMEKVDDESDLDDDEYESDEEEEDDENEDNNGDYNDDNNDYSDSEGGKKDIFAEEKEDGRMSSFEKSQATLKAEIAALEAETLESERPWALRGEINALQRPSDSLLEEAVDFDSLARPTPQITEERSEEIEDVIKRRIEEAAWDDVERKDGRDLTLLNGMTASTQKSARPLLEDVATAGPHRSLTQVYEDDATAKLTGQTALDEETREKQTELTALFAKICRHVDGLSGNRFAPKVYVQSDFQVKTLGKK